MIIVGWVNYRDRFNRLEVVRVVRESDWLPVVFIVVRVKIVLRYPECWVSW